MTMIAFRTAWPFARRALLRKIFSPEHGRRITSARICLRPQIGFA